MAVYPKGRFINGFAERTLANLSSVMSSEKIKYEDTALISFLLAVFVLPHERRKQDGSQDKFMADILRTYNGQFSDVVEVLRSKNKSEMSDAENIGIPQSIDDIPKYLRHAIAHFNIKPESTDDQNLTHLLVWNREPRSDVINFVARIDLKKLVGLAEHILSSITKKDIIDKYEAIDPIKCYDKAHKNLAASKVP